MLDYEILQNKSDITLKSDYEGGTTVKCKNLLSSTFNNNLPLMGNICIVNKYYIARPDLISLAYYNTDKYADVLCKINGISNPFELNENDIITIPSYEVIEEYLSINDANTQFNNDLTENTENNSTEVKIKKLLNEARTPANRTINDDNYIVDKTNKLIFY